MTFFTEDSNRFVSEDAFKTNLARQLEMSPITLKRLRELGVESEALLRLEYFFYTDSSEKANGLAQELERFKYEVHQEVSESGPNQYLVTGWTTQLRMDEPIVLSWTKLMCELGYKHDCDFDGWGTSPE